MSKSTLRLFVLGAIAISSAAHARDEIFPSDTEYGVQVTTIAPAQRKLPNASSVDPLLVLFYGSEKSGLAVYSGKLAPGQSQVGRKPLEKGASYSIWYRPAGGVDYHSSGPEFKVVGGKIEDPLVKVVLQMRRVDVHHVKVSKPDGSPYEVKGTVTITSPPGSEGKTVVSFPTGHGFDLAPGLAYQVTVRAQSEAGPIQYVKVLDYTSSGLYGDDQNSVRE